jgi:hypothetical protein
VLLILTQDLPAAFSLPSILEKTFDFQESAGRLWGSGTEKDSATAREQWLKENPFPIFRQHQERVRGTE